MIIDPRPRHRTVVSQPHRTFCFPAASRGHTSARSTHAAASCAFSVLSAADIALLLLLLLREVFAMHGATSWDPTVPGKETIAKPGYKVHGRPIGQENSSHGHCARGARGANAGLVAHRAPPPHRTPPRSACAGRRRPRGAAVGPTRLIETLRSTTLTRCLNRARARARVWWTALCLGVPPLVNACS